MTHQGSGLLLGALAQNPLVLDQAGGRRNVLCAETEAVGDSHENGQHRAKLAAAESGTIHAHARLGNGRKAGVDTGMVGPSGRNRANTRILNCAQRTTQRENANVSAPMCDLQHEAVDRDS